jgi:hypothetical protein
MRLDINSYKGGIQNLHVNRPGLRARANTVTILNFDQNLKSNKETWSKWIHPYASRATVT